MTGRLIGLAIRPARYAPMVERDEISIGPSGLDGDHAGKYPDRIVSVLALEDWRDACAALDPPPENLSWLTRRANLLLEGVRLPRVTGAVLRVGAVELEVRKQTHPCKRMEEARAGLLKALARDWRGGVLCRVVKSGNVRVGETAEVVTAPPETERRLP